MACDLLSLRPTGSIVGICPHLGEEVSLCLPIPLGLNRCMVYTDTEHGPWLQGHTLRRRM